MELLVESTNLNDYLNELEEVDFSNPYIKKLNEQLFSDKQTEIKKVQAAYEYVRDKIPHSWDIQAHKVTCSASEVVVNKHGICYAKSNLLAAILRSQGIPTGFCYQRLMIFDTPDKGYSLHTLNGVYFKSLNRWIRLDARGNKPGVQAEFSLNEERLAFTPQEEFDERDYPTIYVKPNKKTIATLKDNTDAIEMYKYYLPEYL